MTSPVKQSVEPDHREFQPIEYLRQFYLTPGLANDEVAICRSLDSWLRRQGRRFDRAIEVGCGPTVHHAMALVSYVRELHLCDYLPANLAEVRRWLDHEPGCFDWSKMTRGILEIEGNGFSEAAIRQREEQLRSIVTSLRHCDLLSDNPLDHTEQYDLVTSYFTAECAAGNRDRWPEVMRRLLGLVKLGGALFIGTMKNCSWYSVFDRKFPAAAIDESDYAAVLCQHGFPEHQTSIEAIPIPDWAEEGFDSILIVSANRTDAR